jgi:tetratricopeptide (TPR) repeat protein
MEVDTSVTLYNIFGWLQTNRKRLVAGAVAVALVAAVVTSFVLHKNQKEADANQELLAQPMGMAAADVPDPNALLKINQDYPGTAAGADAELLAAKTLFLQSKFDAARDAFTKFIADNPDHPLVARAQVGVAASLESEGKISDAVQKYKEVALAYSSQPDISYPVKLTLGRLSESQGKPDAAISYYDELSRINNSYDPWVAEAKERRRLLLAKHPELDKTSGINPYQTTPEAAPASPLSPTPADVQLSAPTAPTAAAAGKTNQENQPLPPMGSPPPEMIPGGTRH